MIKLYIICSANAQARAVQNLRKQRSETGGISYEKKNKSYNESDHIDACNGSGGIAISNKCHGSINQRTIRWILFYPD